jgi:hypothetical protein
MEDNVSGFSAPSAKALGKRRMVDVDPNQVKLMAELACPAPAAESPHAARPPPKPPGRPPPDCRDDAAIAAMYQAQYDAEVAQGVAAQRQTALEEEDDDSWLRMMENDVQEDLSALDIDKQKERIQLYQTQTDFLTKLCDDLDNSRKANPFQEGYGFSDDDTEPHELTEAFLDTNNTVAGTPITSSYFMGINPFEPLAPSPTKPPPAKKYKGAIKIDPDGESEDDEGNLEAPGSQEPVYEIDVVD